MTPLSEALTAAQRSALAALEKAYVSGKLDPREDTPEALSAEANLATQLHRLGISDPVDVSFLAASLDVLREWGVAAPTMGERITEAKVEPASEKQLALMRKLAQERGYELSDYPFTKAEASRAIDEMQKGNYDPKKWADVPF